MKRLAGLLVFLALPALAQASHFVLTDTAGKAHTLNACRGKWVLLNLWATWCAPCIQEMPELEALARSRKNLVELGLAVDGQAPERVMQYAAGLGVTYPVIAGNADIARQFAPRGYPTSILFGPDGRQVWMKAGVVSRYEIAAIMDRR